MVTAFLVIAIAVSCFSLFVSVAVMRLARRVERRTVFEHRPAQAPDDTDQASGQHPEG